MFQYNFVQKPKFLVDDSILNTIFSTISKTIKEQQNWVLNLVFVDDDYMKKLNNDYRWKDYVTDVLSFHYYDDFSNLKSQDLAWEIVFSESKIKSQSKEYWLWEEKEFYKLLIHSVLHIVWYDHEIEDDYEIMNNYENIIWKEIFVN